MTQLSLEERVAILEHQISELKASLANGAGSRDWRSTAGMFAGDEVMKQIDEEVRKIRERDRQRARRRPSSGRKKP